MPNSKFNLIAIVGPTAGGKTSVATHFAARIGGEIISGDSRQVYRMMDLGTGKDLDDYVVEGKQIPYHLIDIVNPGHKYNIYQYQSDFAKAFNDITQRGKYPILCGGSGLYLETVLKAYKMVAVPPNNELQEQLDKLNNEDLTQCLADLKALHNTTDTSNRRRMIRAIEIAEYQKSNPKINIDFPEIKPLVMGVKYDRDSRRKKITQRLKQRLDEGMIDEVKNILATGVSAEDLIYYGLEYKFVTLHVIGELTFDEMFEKLEIAIHQFAKRQMTWFRGMERKGTKIHWLDGHAPMEEKMERIEKQLGEA